MTKLTLSLACAALDRCQALIDGRVGIDGCDLMISQMAPEEAFHRAFRFQEFDITELSLSSQTMMVSRGTAEYVAIPAYVSRMFRHSAIYIRTDRGIATAADLKGKRVGIPEYQVTANIWLRGMLKDDHGVRPEDIHWRRGGLEQPGRDERAPIDLPPGVDLQQIPAERTLTAMLADGELDAVFGTRAPSCFTRGAPQVARLYPDYRREEQSYFRRTGIFPIMHVVGIRRSLVERHPWLPVNVYKAFLAAKTTALDEIGHTGHLHASLPWLLAELDATRELMGRDYWRYGVQGNEHALNTFLGYHADQGLSKRRIAIEELFAESTIDLSKV